MALRLDPDTVANYGNLGSLYLVLNRLDEAKVVLDQAWPASWTNPLTRRPL